MGRTFDFDAAWAEADAELEPPTITLLGRQVELPPRLPARVPLFYERKRLARELGEEVRDGDVLELLEPLIGRELIDELLDAGRSLRDLGAIVGVCFALYAPEQTSDTDDDEVTDNAGKAPAPAAPGSSAT